MDPRPCGGPAFTSKSESSVYFSVEGKVHHVFRLAAVAAFALVVAAEARAQSITFDFEDGTDQGWGNPFSADPGNTVNIPVTSIAGSNRLKLLRDGSFQEAGRRSFNTTDPFHLVMGAAAANEAGYRISYDYYIDTSTGGYGTFLQLGTYVNAFDGYYAQDFPNTGKDLDLNTADLASGNIFSGTVSETFAAKGFDLAPGVGGYELGLIINGNSTAGAGIVYIDNIRITPVPEPAGAALFAVAMSSLLLRPRHSHRA
jgi:hypothetical protein